MRAVLQVRNAGEEGSFPRGAGAGGLGRASRGGRRRAGRGSRRRGPHDGTARRGGWGGCGAQGSEEGGSVVDQARRRGGVWGRREKTRRGHSGATAVRGITAMGAAGCSQTDPPGGLSGAFSLLGRVLSSAGRPAITVQCRPWVRGHLRRCRRRIASRSRAGGGRVPGGSCIVRTLPVALPGGRGRGGVGLCPCGETGRCPWG